jgi:hypothetical protein
MIYPRWNLLSQSLALYRDSLLGSVNGVLLKATGFCIKQAYLDYCLTFANQKGQRFRRNRSTSSLLKSCHPDVAGRLAQAEDKLVMADRELLQVRERKSSAVGGIDLKW